MQTQYSDFEGEKKQFEEMNQRMDDEKRKVVQEREKIEQEIRSIKVLNEDLYQQNGLLRGPPGGIEPMWNGSWE